MKHSLSFCLLLAGAALSLNACTGASEPVGIHEQEKSLMQDLSTMFSDQEPVTKPLSLYDAMARALAYNLDARVVKQAEATQGGKIDQEALGILPRVTAGGSYSQRDTREVIEGRNAATGLQSLPPTQFQDTHQRDASLDISWNILDAGLAYARTQSATDQQRIAQEQRRRATQSILRDVRAAYYRAASAQHLEGRITSLNKKALDITKELERAETAKNTADTGEILRLQRDILDALNDLHQERAQLATAKEELAGLMGLSPEADFTLAASEADILQAPPKLNTKKEDLYAVALLVRPELREGILQQRIASRGQDMEMIKTLPILGGTLGYYYDSNSFLSNANWTGASISVTQNLLNLFSLPLRQDAAAQQEMSVINKRQALAGAVLTQVNVARTSYQLAQEEAQLARSRYGVAHRTASHLNDAIKQMKDAKQEPSLRDNAALVIAELDQLLSRTRLMTSMADAQNDYGRMMASLGLDPLPPTLNEQDVTTMAQTLKQRDENVDGTVLAALVESIRARTGLLDPQKGIMANLRAKPVELAEQKI
jgi:outer membrane protein TolC